MIASSALRASWWIALVSKFWAARAFLGGLVAIGVALLGQATILRDRSAPAAFWFYGFALALAIFTLLTTEHGRTQHASEIEESKGNSRELGRTLSGLRFWTGIGASVCLILTAGALVLRSPGQRWSGFAWALGLAVLVAVARRGPAPYARIPFVTSWEDDVFAQDLPKLRPLSEALLVTVMMFVATALRLWQLESHPGVFGDEGERGLQARAILQGRPTPFFGFGWGGVSNVYFYTVAATLRLFGDGLFGLRILSVLSALVAVFYIYRIGRLFWGPRAGLLAGMFLALSPLQLQFSRLAGESALTAALWTAGFFYLFWSLRSGRFLHGILSGIFLGLSLYFYHSAKLLLLLLPLLAAYALVRASRPAARKLAWPLAGVFFAFLLTCLPYGAASWREGWQGFGSRYQERSIFSPKNRRQVFEQSGLVFDAAWTAEPLQQSLRTHAFAWGKILLTQMRRSVDVLYRSGDPTAFYQIRDHNGSMLSPLMAALTLLGLGYATAKLADARFGLLCLWFWGGLLGPALTLDTPSVQRLAGAWPVVMLFPAVLVDRVAASASPLDGRLTRRWIPLALVGLLTIVCTQSIREYFAHYRSLAPFGAATTQARYAQTLGQDYKAYQFGIGTPEGPDVSFGYASTRFLAKGVEGVDVTVLSNILPVTDNGRKGVAFIVYGWNAEYLPILRLFYPGGTEEIVRDSNGAPVFTAYKLGAGEMTSLQTLHASYAQPNGKSVERDEPNLGTLRGPDQEPWSPPKGLAYPAVARWEGALIAADYGLYTFTLTGAGDAELWIDGSCIVRDSGREDLSSPATGTPWVLAKGTHEIGLTGTLLAADSRISLTSRFERGNDHPVDSHLLFGSFCGGLSGEVWTAESLPITGRQDVAPSVRRVDPVFGFREARDDHSFGQGPFAARWTGTIRIERTGEYRFETGSNGGSRLRIDSQEVVSNPGRGRASGSIPLESGLHYLDLTYEWEMGRAWLELYWTPPSGRRELVPPDVLLPASRCMSVEIIGRRILSP